MIYLSLIGLLFITLECFGTENRQGLNCGELRICGQTLRMSSFLLELLHKQQKYGFLNLCNPIHAVEEKFLKKITFEWTFFRFYCGTRFAEISWKFGTLRSNI
jgi:hypothetical protein